MSGSFTLPPIGFGPGSQPLEDEDGLSYLPMPSGVRTYAPHVPDVDDPARVAPALDRLAELRTTLVGWTPGATGVLTLDGLDDACRALIADTLGEGEVAAVIETDDERIEVQEAVFAGVWTIRAHERVAGGTVGGRLRERIEVAAFPAVARARAFPAAVRVRPDAAAMAGDGVVNAPAILTELFDHSARCQPGTAPHVINLSLLPHTPEDLALIETALGRGRTTILSRGYGNCRIDATATRHVWRVRYYNSMDTLILDTIEVVDIPEVACAAPEDIADSAERLGEVLAALRQEAS